MDNILQSKGLFTISQIAKDYGMSARGLPNVLSVLCLYIFYCIK
ncbi:hypothetical protein [Lysinibacillus fusiformis]